MKKPEDTGEPWDKPYPKDWSTTPGIYTDIPDSVYHADQEAISNSQLCKVHESVAKWQASRMGDDEDTLAMLQGRAFHTLVLEPHKFRSRYLVTETMNRNKTLWKSYVRQGEIEGRDVLQEHETENLMKMAQNVLASPWDWLITGEDCLREVVVVAQDTDEFRRGVLDSLGAVDFRDAEQQHGPLDVMVGGDDPGNMTIISQDISTKGTNLWLRCKIDSWMKPQGIWTDVKTTRSGHPDEFDRLMYNRNYHMQAALYSDIGAAHGVEPKHFALLCVEKQDPWMVQAFRVGDASLAKGRIRYCALLDRLKRAIRDGIRPVYDQRILDIDIPGWAMNKPD